MPLISISNLQKRFGGLVALDKLDITIESGTIHSIIGPNGAGKSTFINVVSGALAATRGNITFNGMNITGYSMERRVRMGLARTFQAGVLLRERSVLENVIMGCGIRTGETLWGSLIGSKNANRAAAETRHKAMEMVAFMGLAGWEKNIAKDLPHGLQRALGISIALSTNPQLLMLDEPLTGMNTTEITTMMGKIKDIRDRGTTIILVEHNMKAVMGLSDRITVLSYGEKIGEGKPDEIKTNKEVIEAYLGSQE
jgi:ABC-type branched-subunit amino acid transport system ATPase component